MRMIDWISISTAAERGRVRGFTLIELMVALTISSFLLIGATTIYMQGRTSFRVTESVSRIQEDARFALDLLEADIRMASYYGLQSRPIMIENRAEIGDPVPVGLNVANDCRNNWSIDLDRPIEVENNGYSWVGCAPFGAAEVNSDTLVVRRVSEDPVAVLDADTMHLQSARFRSSVLFVGNAVPGGFAPPPTSATHELVVNGYYVSRSSDGDANTPSLRRFFLTDGPQVGPVGVAGGEEILAGVEDMQIQFGVDTDPRGAATRGSVNRYVNADDPMLDPASAAFNEEAQIIAVRIWLLVRAELPENGFADDRDYAYADRNLPGPQNPPNFRRMLVSRTIFLRNVRTII